MTWLVALAFVLVGIVGVWRWRKYQDSADAPSYREQLDAWASSASDIKPLDLPPVRPLKATKSE